MAKKRKFNKSKEWLIEQYVIFDRPRKEIAAECGLSEAGLKSLLAEFKILKNKFTIDKKEKLQALQKSPELLETPEMDNQQPSIINTGSTTISNESTSKQMEVGDTLNSDDIV